MRWKRGDRVRFLDQAGEGVITQIMDAHQCLVEDETGFDYPHQFSNLVPILQDKDSELKAYESIEPDIQEVLDRNMDEGAVKVARQDFQQKYKDREPGTFSRDDFMEVDLHIHELVDNERGMESGDKLDLQIRHFERMMKRAEQKKFKRIVFIHGVGQGVLRAQIRKLIEQYYPNASFNDANYQEYGYGATEVRIRYN